MSQARERLSDRIDGLRDDDEDAYVITTAPAPTVIGWAAELEPEAFADDEPEDTYPSEDEHGPPLRGVPPGHRVVLLWWD